jgi:hypothetical protein
MQGLPEKQCAVEMYIFSPLYVARYVMLMYECGCVHRSVYVWHCLMYY